MLSRFPPSNNDRQLSHYPNGPNLNSSTNISVIHEACGNIYVSSSLPTLLFRRIVEHITLYSHYGRLQLLLERALTQPLFSEATENFGLQDSSFSTATRYGLHGPGNESLWCEIFRFHPEGPWGPPKLQYDY